MTGPAAGTVREHGNAYNIFILVLTILSLVVMASMILPVDAETRSVLMFYDNLICVVFLIDFTYNITGAHPRSAYFIRGRGWLDLLGSIPALGFFQYTALLRLFRLSRLARISRMLRGKQKKALIADVVRNRGQYAIFITLLLIMIVLTSASVLILQFESRSPDANITTGGDALWWAVVTITTVGYGDFYPVTTLGRLVAVAVMFAGIGIIGALASILASLLVTSAPPLPEDAGEAMPDPLPTTVPAGASGTDDELERTRRELADARAELAELAELRGQRVVQDPEPLP